MPLSQIPVVDEKFLPLVRRRLNQHDEGCGKERFGKLAIVKRSWSPVDALNAIIDLNERQMAEGEMIVTRPRTRSS